MSATEAYVVAQQTAAKQIDTLTAALAEHHDDTPAYTVHYGHVGDINYVNVLLAQAIGFLTGASEEVAP